ncbi:fumarylacetoacetate hydrolase family protein [Garicola koreensis]|uniref:2-keto-4-pentenoate hydratase/2-oxohepta-3-ene-1,7-dioic acid hydratase in catechol pathway n=1 Tax=Garicola koreensis TaxID=1262554 RepID=A0A7W5XK61_9MICC|nr:2-keto-4-pentenoate hydratase/2-oxohepta-3-ene-1,7-dioic acid hydratase in catechol pathway [Garicola koreensis]
MENLETTGEPMKVYVQKGRAFLLGAHEVVDIHERSGGEFSPHIEEIYPRWSDFLRWAQPFGSGAIEMGRLSSNDLGAISPAPRQVLAIGLNYVDHAAESGFTVPEFPIVFTKFQSSIVEPFGDLALTSNSVDWEVELVAVIGNGGRGISAENAWKHVAGLTIGQDYSDRDVQFRGQPPQFSLGKSFAGFAPIGPVLVTPDEFMAQEDSVVQCTIDGEIVQSSPVSDMVFGVAELIEELSAVVELLPGDVLFTGTPPGVGFARVPQRYLRKGERVRSSITGLGYMEQICR